ncbi:MAG: MFS transporter [Clostridia bacterium]|nr:MFS transporter [Clostridia bacterium]
MVSQSIQEPESKKSGLSKSTLLLLLCWIVYTCSYIGKLSYGANIKPIGDAFDVLNADTGLVSTCFFFAYGIGQIVNGILCKKYNVKYVVFTCLAIASAMNLCVGFCPNFALLKYFWLVNGIVMSFLWPTLIRLLSETMKKDKIDRAIVVMGTTVATGTFLIYGISALFTAIADYRWSFCVAATLLLTISIIWFFSFDRLVPALRRECAEEEKQEKVVEEKSETGASGAKVALKGLALLICILAFFAVVNNFVKDGLTTWTPDILNALYGTQDWLSILLTLLLPLLAIPGTVFAVKVYNVVKKYIGACTVMFVMSAVLMGLVIMFTFGFSGSTVAMLITVVSFALISALMSGIDNIIVSMVPLQLKKHVNSGKLAGILNGFCYLGSTISMYGLGAIADNWGWEAGFYVLLGLIGLVVVVGIIYNFISKKHVIR